MHVVSNDTNVQPDQDQSDLDLHCLLNYYMYMYLATYMWILLVPDSWIKLHNRLNEIG